MRPQAILLLKDQCLLGVKLASVYVALALCRLTLTALLVQTLCTHTHEPSSGDVKL